VYVLVAATAHDEPGEVQPDRSAAFRALAGEAESEANKIREGSQARHERIATGFFVCTQASMRPDSNGRQAGARFQADSDLSGTPRAVG
jgi:hypothetical protein